MRFDDQKPIYRQITGWMEEKIIAGVWLEGERAPAVRDVAMLLQVNPNTALRAFDDLQERGVIQNRRGLGYFVEPGARKIVLGGLRDKFMTDELPAMFDRMNLLEVAIETIAEEYKKHKPVK